MQWGENILHPESSGACVSWVKKTVVRGALQFDERSDWIDDAVCHVSAVESALLRHEAALHVDGDDSFDHVTAWSSATLTPE